LVFYNGFPTEAASSTFLSHNRTKG
jgi:hypothetical protein